MGWRTGPLAVIAGAALPAAAAAQERVHDWGWGMHPVWGAWGIGMMLVILVFWGLVIVGLVLGTRWLLTQGKERTADSALEILRQRYARGEIDREEFQTKRRDLG